MSSEQKILGSSTNEAIDDVSKVCNEAKQQVKSKQTCKMNKQADHICTDPKCDKHILICQDRNCECRKQHSTCMQVFLEGFKNKITSKDISLAETQKQLTTQIQKSLEELNNFNKEIKKKFSNKFQYFGMSHNDKKFLSDLKQGNISGYKGIDTETTLKAEAGEAKCEKLRKNYLTNSLSVWEKCHTQIRDSIKNMQNSLEDLRFSSQSYDQIFLPKSKIISSKDYEQKIHRFFPHKLIASISLLYNGTKSLLQKGFDANQFYEKCKDVEHTLVLVKARRRNLVIGAYTPLRMNESNEKLQLLPIGRSQTEVIDETGQSFLFIINAGQNDRMYVLDKSKPAITFQYIKNQRNKVSFEQVVFGSASKPSLVLKTQTSIINLCGSYLRRQWQQQFYNQSLFGYSPQRFPIQFDDWEVWKLQFKD